MSEIAHFHYFDDKYFVVIISQTDKKKREKETYGKILSTFRAG